ncbi:MAG TPA: Rap1a/Tai family immunity protein [Parvibaculum sp.]
MKNIIRAALTVAFIAASTAAVALPRAEEDIHTGADLIAACHALTAQDTSDAGTLASTACRHFLGTMVLKVYKATTPGMPTEFSRIGPKGDETACFRLPPSLPYTDLAGYIASYYEAHPELGERPAFELAARTLAAKYPCPQ